MTPMQALERVKDSFVVLYVRDEKRLSELLEDTLGKFQEKAGVVASFGIEEKREARGICLPPHFLDLAVTTDADGEWCQTHVVTEGDKKKLNVMVDDTTRYPVTVSYFCNLRDWPKEENLPHGVVNFVLDHLKAAIAIPNVERERNILVSSGLPVELPTQAELKEELQRLEEGLSDNSFQLPAISVSGSWKRR